MRQLWSPASCKHKQCLVLENGGYKNYVHKHRTQFNNEARFLFLVQQFFNNFEMVRDIRPQQLLVFQFPNTKQHRPKEEGDELTESYVESV